MKLSYIFYFFTICTVATCFLLLASCSDDESADTMPPLAIFTSPADATTYSRGQSLICNAVFEDDHELSHVEINVNSLNDLKGWDSPWEASETIELSGKQAQLDAYQLFGEAIPSEIESGPYAVEFLVVDKALNYTKYAFEIIIE